MSEEHEELRRLLGGYVLGGLGDVDTERLDAHLRDCDRCRLDLELLAPVPELLQRVPDTHREVDGAEPVLLAAGARPSRERIEGLLQRMRIERSRERRVARLRWLAAAAVVVITAAIGLSVLARSQTRTLPNAISASPELITAQFEPTAGSGLAGEAILTAKSWGVSVAVDVSRLPGTGPYVCQVHAVGGSTEQAAVWGATPNATAKVIGASSFQARTVDAVTISDTRGHVLATATVR